MLPREELRQVFLQTLGGDEKKLQDVLAGKKKVVNSCGSGMTAAIIWLALRELGAESAIYDEVSLQLEQTFISAVPQLTYGLAIMRSL